MRIEAYYDILCPFSFLAKRYLDIGMERFPDVAVSIQLHPFMLHPQLPRGRHSFRAAFTDKYGEDARVPMWDRVIALGREVGIAFAFYDIEYGADAAIGHRAVRFAGRYSRDRDMLERIYRAFYEQARYVGDPQTLAELGADLGLPREEMATYLASDEDDALMFALTEQYKQDPGVNRMPFHVVDGAPFAPPTQLEHYLALFERKAGVAA